MIASKLITAPILFFAAAMSVNAAAPGGYINCMNIGNQQEGKGTPHRIPFNRDTNMYSLAGFTVKRIRPGVYDIHAGPTRATESVVKLHWYGNDPDRTFRYAFRPGQICTARFPEGPPGSAMEAFVETF